MSEDNRVRVSSPTIGDITNDLPDFWGTLVQLLPPQGHFEPIETQVRQDPDFQLYAVEGRYEPGPTSSKFTLTFSCTQRGLETPQFEIALGYYNQQLEFVEHRDFFNYYSQNPCSVRRYCGVEDTSVDFIKSKHPLYTQALGKLVDTMSSGQLITACSNGNPC